MAAKWKHTLLQMIQNYLFIYLTGHFKQMGTILRLIGAPGIETPYFLNKSFPNKSPGSSCWAHPVSTTRTTCKFSNRWKSMHWFLNSLERNQNSFIMKKLFCAEAEPHLNHFSVPLGTMESSVGAMARYDWRGSFWVRSRCRAALGIRKE